MTKINSFTTTDDLHAIDTNAIFDTVDKQTIEMIDKQLMIFTRLI